MIDNKNNPYLQPNCTLLQDLQKDGVAKRTKYGRTITISYDALKDLIRNGNGRFQPCNRQSQ